MRSILLISGKPVLLKRLIIFFFLLPFGCLAQVANKPEVKVDSTVAKNINAKLGAFLTDHPAEKAYLQLDKPYYAAGDTLYFKAYVTLGEYHQLSSLSGVLHVDLIDAASKVSQSMVLQLIDGVAWGDFALPIESEKGQYRIRAYTRWMRNAGEGSFFEHSFSVGSLNNTGSATKQVAEKPDMRFFPEGGTFVAGTRSKVAFKAIGGNGLGIGVKGVVVDNDNKEVLSFASTHLGMGYFNLDVIDGKTYKARVTYPNGTEDMVDLPKPDIKGIMLSVDDSLQLAAVRVRANKAWFQENRDKDYTLSVYSGGVATTIIFKLVAPAAKIIIDKQDLPTGIAKITLFSPTGEPLSERLLFIQNHDQLKLNISSDKTIYAKRGNVNLKLNAVDKDGKPAEGHFSVDVVDQSKVPSDENAASTILSNLLLTSDLTGYVEDPSYYFNNAQTAKDIDLVMLTHGYRRFEWKTLMGKGYPAAEYPAEKLLEISGSAKVSDNRPLLNGTVSLISKSGGGVFTQKTDANGNFRFTDLSFLNGSHYVLSSIDDNGAGKNTQVVYNREQTLPVAINSNTAITDTNMAAYMQNRKRQIEDAGYNPENGKLLKQVNIKEKGNMNASRAPDAGTTSAGDQILYSKDLEGSGQLSAALIQKVPGFHFELSGHFRDKIPVLFGNHFDPKGGHANPGMIMIVDGIDYTGSIDGLNVEDIESIVVLGYHSSSGIFYGALGRGEGGYLIITTKYANSAGGNKIGQANGVLLFNPPGFYKAREFYVPKYEHVSTAPAHEDLRPAIYWNPEVLTDKNGNASFSYPNADGIGNYLVVIEGIDNNGNLGSIRYTYKVQ